MSPPLLLAAAVVLVAILALVLWALRPKKPKPWIQVSTCPACGWSGQVSRYAGRCPACNAALGDRLGSRSR